MGNWEVVFLLLFTTTTSTGGTALSDGNQTISFSQEYFGVVAGVYNSKYDPVLLLGDSTDLYTEAEMLTLVKRISSRFSIIMGKSIPTGTHHILGNDLVEFALAVAKFNQHFRSPPQTNNTLPPPLELILIFFPTQENFRATKELADKVNLIFPGTVKQLLHASDYAIGPVQVSATIQLLRHAGHEINNSNNSTFSYQLGTYLTILECELLGSKPHPDFEEVASLLQTVFFGNYISTAPVGDWQGVTSAFTTCSKAMKNKYPELDVAFMSGMARVGVTEPQQISQMMEYWRRLDEWAGREKVRVIMADAFDTLTVAGWWKLDEGVSTARMEPEFLELPEILNKEKETPGYIKTLSKSNSLSPASYDVYNTSNFSDTLFGVLLHPFLSPAKVKPDQHPRTEFFDDQSLTNIVSMIASKFKKIRIPPLEGPGAGTLAKIPYVVANYNLDRSEKKESHHLSLAMTVDVRLDSSEKQVLELFRLTEDIASKANAIYEASVTQIVIQANISEPQIRQLVDVILPKVRLLTSLTLGAFVSHASCGYSRTRMASDLTGPLLTHVDVLYFGVTATSQKIEGGLDLVIGLVWKTMLNCKLKVEETYRKAVEKKEIGFELRFNEVEGLLNETESLFNLVVFWEKMNLWAETTSTPVVMWYAIGSQTGQLGWWRLKDGNAEPYGHASEIIYEDKRDVLVEKLKPTKVGVVVPPPRLNIFTAAGIVSGTILLMLVAAFGIAFWLRRSGFRFGHRRNLTKSEIRDFFEGGGGAMELTHLGLGSSSSHSNSAYDTNLELALGSFEIDHSVILGTGAFGAVYRGKVFRNEVEIEAAVKTTKPSCPGSALKGLLSEIKVMMHVGEHGNVVKLLGAYTSELFRGKVYVFMEFCPLGSLLDHLRQLSVRSTSGGSGDPTDPCTMPSRQNTNSASTSKDNNSLHSSELLKWAFEIASGMEYLASKQVVHMDLATRNVLLNEDRVAKMSDFGLSRRLYEYTTYVKSTTTHEALPWRWMSPESLSRSEFNQKSDVWSFGVTLWEIFSLGDIPYGGMSWSVDWASQLNEGLILQKPQHGSNDIYSKMKECWNLDPTLRPSFSLLKSGLGVLLQTTRSNEVDYLEM